jgi:hypothetical protein
MVDAKPAQSGIVHGTGSLPSVTIDSWNVKLKDGEDFLGDRASKKAFVALLDERRKLLTELGQDPWGDTPTSAIGRKTLDKILIEGDARVAGVILSAVEDFAGELSAVLRRFLKLKDWKGTERVAVGGGMRNTRIGQLAIGRAEVMLKSDDIMVDLKPIRHHPDEAALVGAGHLAPSWIFSAHDALLAVDIGGTNMRAGVVRLNQDKDPTLAEACVWKSELWRHADDRPTRNQAVERLADMLRRLAEAAQKKGLNLAPFIGIGCPGVIREDGSIANGAQNLPGNWEADNFNLPARIQEALPEIGGHETMVLMHNDAVLQGLSEIPYMTDVERWGILTIGTGLGNARFSNRKKPQPAARS